MYDTEFASLVNPVNANKKVYWMQQCASGGFWQELWGMNNIFHSSCLYYESAFPCDNKNIAGETVIENEEISGLTYRHGEFNFHNYSCMVGESPAFVDNYDGQPYTEADLNGDGFISILESYDWESSHESIDYFDPWSGVQGETPLYIDENDLGKYTTLEYPTLLHGNITYSYECRGLIGITKENNPTIKDVHITAGEQLTFHENSQIRFLNNANLYIDAGASLIINNDVTFNVNEGTSKIIVNGNITIGSNVNFIAENSAQIWLEINNTSIDISIDSPVFENGVLIAYNNHLSLTNPSFTNSGIYGFNGNFDISEGQFNNSFTQFGHPGSYNGMININNCNFYGTGFTAIDIDEYPNYSIEYCNIDGFNDGVSLFYCGYGSGKQHISNCNIINNSTSGIMLYLTIGDILHNTITGNGIGIKCFNRCYTHIEGNHQFVTQEISNNTSNEIYATSGSFPQYLHWNKIGDDDNLPDDPLIKYTGIEINLDVKYNCWDSDFNPLNDLSPAGSYIWNPTWFCYTASDSVSCSGAEALYLEAREEIKSEEYIEATEGLKQIVEEYPETEFAKAAMKELFHIEEYTNNNYVELKDYYNENYVIQGDTSLSKLSDFLVNFCEIKLENYPTAIAWFENVIQNPESIEDSIFAIIDLGYTYFLMENGGLKAAYAGALTEHIPVSRKQFEEKRDYLLSLLPGDQMNETMKEGINSLKPGELLQNVPNPFGNSTQIWYKLENESYVDISIYNYSGQKVKTINEGIKSTGSHYMLFNANGLESGVYFYTISVNGMITDTKKMTILK